MRQRMSKIAVALVVIALLLSFGCDLTLNQGGTGSLAISLEGSARNLVWEPELDLDIASYTISGMGPTARDGFEVSGHTGGLFTRDGLAVGNWTISVDGYNEDGVKIATAEVNVAIARNTTTPVEVVLRPLEGTGALSVDVSWADSHGLLTAPGVTVVIRDEEGNDIENISSPVALTVDGQTASAAVTGLPSGWYEVTVALSDGSTTVWQGVFALRVVVDRTTTGTVTIPEEQIQFGTGMGSVSITIVEDMNNPLPVGFTGLSESVEAGATVTVSSTESYSGEEQYRWYVNGVRQTGETASSFTYTFNEPGTHTLSLLVLDGGALGGFGESLLVEEWLFPQSFILKVETGSQFDLQSILSDEVAFPGAYLEGDYVVWEDTNYRNNYLQNLPDNFSYPGCNGLTEGDPGIVHKIYSQGKIETYLNTEDPLLSLSMFTEIYGFSNAYDFANDTTLSGVAPYKDLLTTSDFVRQNLLGANTFQLYKKLYREGCITSGIHDTSTGLYDAPWILYNNTGRRVVILRSMLYNVSLGWTYQNELNQSWSPIADNPMQSIALSRSFDIAYQSIDEGVIYIHTFTDNGMSGNTKMYGMSSLVPDYSRASGPYSISYNSTENTYQVSNSSYGGAGVMLYNEFPTRVEMSNNYSWSLAYQMIFMAMFDGDIITENHTELPWPGDDDNPIPLYGYLHPGANQ